MYSDEYETAISDLDNTLKIYENLGYYKAITVNKHRREWEYDEFIIAYDCIENLGNFFEIELKNDNVPFETGQAKIKQFIASVLGEDYALSNTGYPTLIYQLNNHK